MLGNCEKMVVIPQNTKEWPQRQLEIIDDQNVSTMASSSSFASAHHQRVMEKPNQELLQQQQEALKCPRCDSSNTKFCYYNNYSLSQPRYFCKACKRYWTRGGTLRNVPVGGGCRKNKRVKRPSSSASSETHNITSNSSSTATVSATVSNPPSQSQIDVASTSNHINPLFYGMNLPAFPRFNSSTSGFDHHHLQRHQMNHHSLGLDFTDVNGYRNGFSSSNHHTPLSSYSSSIFANSSSSASITTSSSPIMASLLSSTNLQQQKFINGGGANHSAFHQGFTQLEDLAIAGNNNNNNNSTSTTEAEMVALKEVKSVVVEGDNNSFLGWQNNQIDHHHQATGLSDPSSLYWNAATALGSTTWNDQNIGPHQSLLSSDLQ